MHLIFIVSMAKFCPAGWNDGDEGMKDTPAGVANYLSQYADKL